MSTIPAADVRKHPVFKLLERTVREVLAIPEGPLTDRTLRAALDAHTDRAHREGHEQAGLDLQALQAQVAELYDRLERARAVLDHAERPAESGVGLALYDTPIEDLELTVRAEHALQNLGVTRLGQIVRCTEGELLRSRFVGRKTLQEIQRMLAEKGLRLRRR